MDRIIGNLSRLFKHGRQLKDLQNQLHTKDHPEITNFLKNNQQFVRMTKKASPSMAIEYGKRIVERGPPH